MIATGTLFIALALVELIGTTFRLEFVNTDRPFEEVVALLGLGFAILFFGTPDAAAARMVTAPVPPPAYQPEGQLREPTLVRPVPEDPKA
jgi:hypothetical protein